MQYREYLLNVLKGDCPFCDIKKEFILEKWKHFTVILSRAPYTKDHLLIVPHRHIIRMKEIKPEERWTLIPLIEKWTKKLEKLYQEVNLLLRDWVANWTSGKSINHLHFHLVPDCEISAKNSLPTRLAYSDYQLEKQTTDLKLRLKRK